MSPNYKIESAGLEIRTARESDLPRVMALDEATTDLPKPDYWRRMFDEYSGGAKGEDEQRFFLVAKTPGGPIIGFIIGEVRAWEFGEPPCGWIIGVNVEPGLRQENVGTHMMRAICDCFAKAGVDKVRTLPARNNQLLLSFFRSQGMMAGPSIQLEMALDRSVDWNPELDE